MAMYDVYINTYGTYWSDNFCVNVKGVNLFTMTKLIDASHASSDINAALKTALFAEGKASASWEARGGKSYITIENS